MKKIGPLRDWPRGDDRLERSEHRDERALAVDGAAPVEDAVLDLCAPRVARPVAGHGVDGVVVGVEEDAGPVALALEHAEHERRLATLDGVLLDRHAEIAQAAGDPLVRGRLLADDAADADDLGAAAARSGSPRR